MPVNLEIKGSLAKCLATENLIIENKKVSTASFDVEKRILTLPMWQKASATVYDLLVGHEVGHALFTDNIDWREEYPNLPKDFVNVIEDVRIERMMKKKYPGLSRTFYNGYNELNTQDFFCTDGEDLNNLSFIDRINLYFKIGAFHNIAFSDEENEFVTRISQAETFQDVLEISQDIYDYLKGQETKQEIDAPAPQTGSEGGEDSVDSQEENEQSEDQEEEEGEGDDESEGESGEKSDNFEQSISDEFESKTSQAFSDKAENLTDKFGEETNYVDLPKINLENVILPNEYIHSLTSNYWQKNCFVSDWFKEVSVDYAKYKKSAQKEVNYLVKEFECKKSADSYARSSTSRTGVLDCTKLHTYKYNEDLFKKVTVVPDGKNHGLIFILDWSGSMCKWMLDTCKQMFNIVWFCKKANLPFEVYAFTNDPNAYLEHQPDHPPIYQQEDGVLALEPSFRLMNLLTSKTNAKELDAQMKNIWACASAYQTGIGYTPSHMQLSGTPMGESLVALHHLIPNFQNQNKLQKVNVVFLTDGEGYVNPSCVKRVNERTEEEYFGYKRTYEYTLRVKKTGRTYSPYHNDSFSEYAKILLTSLKESFPTCNFVNFRVAVSRDFKTCWDWYGRATGYYDQVKKVFKKKQYITFIDTGFDQFNVIPSNSLSQDDEFVVPDDATKGQIKTAFTKMLNKKKTNKKLLSEFVELIA